MGQTYLGRQVDIAEDEAPYDAHAKKILSDKRVLANIMRNATSEFRGMNIDDIIPCIEQEPEVGVVPVFPGQTNKKEPEAIQGLSTESKIPHEGMVTFDIRFFAVTPGGERVKIFIDVEAQQKFSPGYDLVSRGIFYASRMLSAQLDTEFSHEDYNNLKKVYSIWICTDTPKQVRDTTTEFYIARRNLQGNAELNQRYDLLSVVLVCLNNEEIVSDAPELHRMLETLLSVTMKPDEKDQKLQTEFGFPPSVSRKEDLDTMCNLSTGIKELGIQEGIEQEKEHGISALVKTAKSFGGTMQMTVEKLMQEFSLSKEVAEQKTKLYW